MEDKRGVFMAAIDVRIDKWKKRLLDLGKRNRLINYKETKRSNIKIVSPELAGLYKRLVINENALEFPYPIEENYDDEESHGVVSNGDIQTNHTTNEQQKTLRNLREKAKTAIEEQGVNILYLTFGFLKWKESLESEQIITSPIVLVPVTLTLESITSPFVLSLHEDEIVVNPALIYKLENDFGITFPEFDGHEDDVTKYLGRINEIAAKNKWEVAIETGLSLLSFLKINMYKDLDKNKDKIEAHPVLKALSGDVSQVKTLPEEYNNYDHDNNTRPIDLYQVVDADSSQQDAILYSKKGISFVLQGPPGTGKSQTITNIIAESLADGKKVLFVSEKMAALQVVHKRLSQAGLADFCLTLHSHKANKKEVLNELGKTLSINRLKLQDEALYQLESLQNQRDKLNRYNMELHTICQPLNKSIFDINGKLAKLFETPDVIFSLEDIGGTTPEKLHKYIYLLNELSKTIGKMSEDYEVNPWRSCNVPNVPHELRHDIETYLRRLVPKIKTLAETYDNINKGLDLDRKSSITATHELIEILELSAKSPKVPVAWIYEEDISPLVEQAKKYRNLNAEYQAVMSELSAKYDGGFFALPATSIQEEFEATMCGVKRYLNSETFNADAQIISAATNTIAVLENAIEKISIANSGGILISEKLAIKQKNTLVSLISMYEMLGCMLSDPRPTQEWFDANRFGVVKKLFAEAKEVHSQLDTAIKAITSRYDREILTIDYSSILKRFKTEYTSVFKVFKRRYKADKDIIRVLVKDMPKKIDDDVIISILNQLKEIADKKAWITDNEELLANLLGSNYAGDHTDWSVLEKAIGNFDTIVSYFAGELFPLKVREFLLAGVANNQEIKPQYDRLAVVDTDILASINRVFSTSLKADNIELTALDQSMRETVEILKIINGLYVKITSYCRQTITFDEAIDNIAKLGRLQVIEHSIGAQSDILKTNYQFLFNGINTNWDTILHSLTWTSDIKKLNQKYALSRSFIERICTDIISTVAAADGMKTLQQKLNDISEEWNWYINLFDDKVEFLGIDLFALLTRVEKCLNSIYSLEEWIDFRSCREDCKKEGLSEYIEKIEAIKIDRILIVDAFAKRFYRLWLDAVMPNYPAVYSFRRRSQEDTIREFEKLDLTQLSIARSRVKERLVSRLPDLNRATSAVDEVGILKRELNKQRKIMPLRKLFKAIPNLLLTLKPCLMMSPLSVSLFLEAENYTFDLVIFDEASQVCTEDAIGAIMRGTQVVITGDSKQLPPTSFFAATTSDGDFDTDDYNEDEHDDTDAFESVLDESITVLPERTLRWHYRSRHEHLIAFSNAKIYNHNLITFPSHIDKVPDNGVEYIYVANGVYDRGGKKNNINEARKVSELVFEHIKKYPNRSLGVVTFSEAQQQAVETAIRQFRLQNQQFESYFSEDKEDRFFVKNLENVQGDERDTIIFSIGYAKDSNGVIYMNFGPLSRSGGYRRLNVAITRAKYNVKLVGSIHPTDIKLESTNSEGVKMLRSYIEFAMNGAEVLQRELSYSDTVEVDSPFEESVYDFLVKNRYMVATQVGCSGYRIDLGVKHPTLNGRFVLGVECDGATYHSARTARERDRLRQTVLEDIGWKIYRIWSTDWIKDPVSEGEKLLEAVKKAISEHADDGLESGNRNEEKEVPVPQDEFLITEVPNEQSSSDEVHGYNTYGFDYYEEANVNEIDRYPDDTIYLAKVICHVVKKEYPIHFELLCKRIACLFGNQKATVKVRNSAEFVMNNNLYNSIERRGNFCWVKQGTNEVSARIPQPYNTGRPINYISTEELAEAMFQIASQSFGIAPDDLCVATARAFGFNRTGGNITQAMQKACESLLKTSRVKNVGGKIIIQRNSSDECINL
jgi:very-short-patch-repair endonuclease